MTSSRLLVYLWRVHADDGLDVARRAVLYEALAPSFFGPIFMGKAENEGQGTDPTGGAINLLIEEAKKQAT
jgi:hypothetical protein